MTAFSSGTSHVALHVPATHAHCSKIMHLLIFAHKPGGSCCISDGLSLLHGLFITEYL